MSKNRIKIKLPKFPPREEAEKDWFVAKSPSIITSKQRLTSEMDAGDYRGAEALRRTAFR